MEYIYTGLLLVLQFLIANAAIDCPADADYVDIGKTFKLIVKQLIINDGKKQLTFDEEIELRRTAKFTLKPKEEFAYRSLTIEAIQASKVVLVIKSNDTGTTKEELQFIEGTSTVVHEASGDGIQNIKSIQIKISAKKKRIPFTLIGVRISGCFPKPILCPELPPLEHGLTVTESRKPGGKAKFYCKSTHELIGSDTSICTGTGQWNSLVPVCKELVHCTRPTHPKNGLVFVNRHHEGSTVHYKCKTGFVLNGPKERFCQTNGKWDRIAPTCDPE